MANIRDDGDPALRSRMISLMRFLKAFQELRYPLKRQIAEQPWLLRWSDIPDHPAVDRAGPDGGEEWLLRVRRPQVTQPPAPPDGLSEWLEGDWKDPFGEPRHRQSKPVRDGDDEGARQTAGRTPPVLGEDRFDRNPQRVEAWRRWRTRWDTWAGTERPARRALQIFEKLHGLNSLLERGGERYELLLGDGLLIWRLAGGGVCHPVLLKRVELTFDPDKPEFILRDSDLAAPELYTGALPPEAVPSQAVAASREELAQKAFHPLGGEETAGFLHRLVNRLSPHRGEYLGELGWEARPAERGEPVIGRSPILFLRERVYGFSTFFEGMAQSLQQGKRMPEVLGPIVGGPAPDHMDGGAPDETVTEAAKEADVLFALPWNQEQHRIAQRLERFGAVVVQGPPGTGKTHTIANLVGHLLAEGKSVLVTAWTAKALRVVRDKVANNLQPLCVSVLQDDMESRKHLEASVEGIVERLSRDDGEVLQRDAAALWEERQRLKERLAEMEAALVEARGAEYRSISIGGKEYPPSEAARLLAHWEQDCAWIPGPVAPGAVLPLSPEELAELYLTNGSLTPEEEAEFAAGLPDIGSLPGPDEVDLFAKRYAGLAINAGQRSEAAAPRLWNVLESQGESLIGAIDALARKAGEEAAFVRERQEWEASIIEAGIKGGTRQQEWQYLLQAVDESVQAAEEARLFCLQFEPELAAGIELAKQQTILREIVEQVPGDGSVSRFALLTKLKWKKLIVQWRVKGREPRHGQEFQALALLADLQSRRAELQRLWERLVVSRGGRPLNPDVPEEDAQRWKPHLEKLLGWHQQDWSAIREVAIQIGLLWDRFIQQLGRESSPAGQSSTLDEYVYALQRLAQDLSIKRDELLRLKVERKLRKYVEQAADLEHGRPAQSLVRRLARALENLDTVEYERCYLDTETLGRKKAVFERRQELLGRLRAVAPGWALAVESRSGVHGMPSLPGEPERAWLWRQLAEELDRRTSFDPQQIQEEMARLKERLLAVTAEIIDKKAWAAQLRRVTRDQQQALMGWNYTMKKVKKGKGKRAPQLLAEAGRLMAKCRGAVPVWIMPLTRVVEQFRPSETEFDVVIIDEASQCDVRALAALCLGKTVVVVGDHEQVSPEAVGLELDKIQGIIEQFLQGIPNNHLYDGQTSVYDLARQSFGGMVTLLEHFRCVPDIIGFSNWLSYEGRIKPLREAGSSRLAPVVPYRVNGASRDGKINEEEARTIVSLIAAMLEHPDYKDRTVGTISLLGGEQAYRIEEMLRRLALDEQIPLRELEKRRFRSGTAAEFQGDERNIMFLSLVDVPGSSGGPLPLRDQDLFKKRFNVAASRAKDQLWVVYSLDPANDLKPGDLRRNLIQYARDPKVHQRAGEEAKAESELERQVIRELQRRGYRVTPQYAAGYYRIDIAVQGGRGEKVAIECDGDRYHPPEKLHEDLERQAVLERVGKWRFFRLRGTEWFRSRDRAMDRLLQWLKEMEIEPAGEGHEAGPFGSSGPATPLVRELMARAQELRRAWGWEKGAAVMAAPAGGMTALHGGDAGHRGGLEAEKTGGDGRGKPGQISLLRSGVDGLPLAQSLAAPPISGSSMASPSPSPDGAGADRTLQAPGDGRRVQRGQVFFISDQGKIHIKQTCPSLIFGNEYVVKTTTDGNEALLAAAGWCPTCGKAFREERF